MSNPAKIEYIEKSGGVADVAEYIMKIPEDIIDNGLIQVPFDISFHENDSSTSGEGSGSDTPKLTLIGDNLFARMQMFVECLKILAIGDIGAMYNVDNIARVNRHLKLLGYGIAFAEVERNETNYKGRTGSLILCAQGDGAGGGDGSVGDGTILYNLFQNTPAIRITKEDLEGFIPAISFQPDDTDEIINMRKEVELNKLVLNYNKGIAPDGLWDKLIDRATEAGYIHPAEAWNTHLCRRSLRGKIPKWEDYYIILNDSKNGKMYKLWIFPQQIPRPNLRPDTYATQN